jgi:hypothetical protein
MIDLGAWATESTGSHSGPSLTNRKEGLIGATEHRRHGDTLGARAAGRAESR